MRLWERDVSDVGFASVNAPMGRSHSDKGGIQLCHEAMEQDRQDRGPERAEG